MGSILTSLILMFPAIIKHSGKGGPEERGLAADEQKKEKKKGNMGKAKNILIDIVFFLKIYLF